MARTTPGRFAFGHCATLKRSRASKSEKPLSFHRKRLNAKIMTTLEHQASKEKRSRTNTLGWFKQPMNATFAVSPGIVRRAFGGAECGMIQTLFLK
jgi:hypothetical protein